MPSSLVLKNISIGDRRTSVRIEPKMWDALLEMAKGTGLSVHDIATLVDRTRRSSSFTAALRVAILDYFRTGSLPSADEPSDPV